MLLATLSFKIVESYDKKPARGVISKLWRGIRIRFLAVTGLWLKLDGHYEAGGF